MGNSLQKQVLYRLLAALAVSSLVVIAATAWFESRALEKTVVSKQRDEYGYFQGRVANLEREWEAQAMQLKLSLEFTRILESSKFNPELLNAFFLVRSSSSVFTRVMIRDNNGNPLFRYGIDEEAKAAFDEIADEDLFFNYPPHLTLYRIFKLPVWLGNAGTGSLSLLTPMDNSLLSHIAYPRTDLYLLFNGTPVAASLGRKGVEQFFAPAATSSLTGQRQTSVSVPWRFAGSSDEPAPVLVIRSEIEESHSGGEITLIVLASLAVLALASWRLLGAWINGIIQDIVLLKASSDTFARERKPLEREGRPGPGERSERIDELGALKTGLVSMMETVVESEQRYKDVGEVLRKAMDFRAAVLDTIDAMVVVLDTQGRFVSFNKACERATGFASAEVIGTHLWDELILPEEAELVKKVFRSLVAGEFPATHENYWRTRDGGKRLIAWSNTALLNQAGEIEYVLATGIDITESWAAERKRLRAEKELLLFRNLVDQSNDAFFVADADTAAILDVNEMACAGLGYGRQELLTLRITDIAEFVSGGVSWQERMEALKKRAAMVYESVHRRKDRSTFPVELSVRFYSQEGKDYLIGVARNITERKKTELELRSKDNAIANAINGIAISDMEGKITYVNRSYVTMLGYAEPGEVLGRPLADFAESADKAALIQEALRSTGGWIGELGGRRKDGTLFPRLMSASMVTDEHGRPISVLGSFVDITGIKQAEEKILAALEEKELLLKEIHHRVKNNLQIIASLLYLQTEEVQDPKTRGLFRESRDRIKSMALVHEKLYSATDLSRIDFMEYCGSLGAYLFNAYGAAAKGIKLETIGNGIFLEVDRAIPCGLILSELLSNALKYAFPAGRQGIIRITASLDAAGDLDLIIGDDGIGLTPGFVLEHSKTLGLRLVHKLTDQLHGRITAASDGGAVFHMTIPLQGRKGKDLANG